MASSRKTTLNTTFWCRASAPGTFPSIPDQAIFGAKAQKFGANTDTDLVVEEDSIHDRHGYVRRAADKCFKNVSKTALLVCEWTPLPNINGDADRWASSCIHMHVYYACIHMHVYIWMYTYACIRTHVYYACIHMHVYICMYTYACIRMHVNIGCMHAYDLSMLCWCMSQIGSETWIGYLNGMYAFTCIYWMYTYACSKNAGRYVCTYVHILDVYICMF
jgi:hypothetical protein